MPVYGDKPSLGPDHKRDYRMQIGINRAAVFIPAPNGIVQPDDAKDMIEWLNMIIRRLERDIENGTPCCANQA